MSKIVKHYKPHLVYELLLDNTYHYVGCHNTVFDYLTEKRILNESGNPYVEMKMKKRISHEEYMDRVHLIQVEEFDSREEALNREVEAIAECQAKYGNNCINKSLGNKYGSTGLKRSEESIKKQSESTRKFYQTEEGLKLRKFYSDINIGKSYHPYAPKKHKMYWFNNGTSEIYATECPEGYARGRCNSKIGRPCKK